MPNKDNLYVTGACISQDEFNKFRTWLWLRGISKKKFLSASLKKDIGENRHLLPILQNIIQAKMQEDNDMGDGNDGN